MKLHKIFRITVLLILSSKIFATDSLQVSGKILDLDNNPIEGAIVSATYGTSDYTDSFGEYNIKIASNAVPIDNPDFKIDVDENIKLSLYNLLGQKVLTQKYYNFQLNQHLATGIYFAVLHTDKQIISKYKVTCINGKLLNLPTPQQIQVQPLQKTNAYTAEITI